MSRAPLQVARGNHELLRERYQKACEYYEMAEAKENPVRHRYDALLNGAMATKKMKLDKSMNEKFASAVELHYRTNYSLEYISEPLEPENRQKDRNAWPHYPQSTTSDLTELSYHMAICPSYDQLVARRADLFDMLDDPHMAVNDAKKRVKISEKNVLAWIDLAEKSYAACDYDAFYEALKKIEELEEVPHRLKALKCRIEYSDELIDELKLAVIGKEPNSHLELTSYFVSEGVYEDISTDFPYRLFTDGLMPADEHYSVPFLGHIISGYYHLFHKHMYEMTASVGLDHEVLQAWIDDDSEPAGHPFSWPNPLLPSGFYGCFAGTEEQGSQLYEASDLIHKNMMREAAYSGRFRICMSFAAIEIAQLIQKWAKGESEYTPTLDLVIALLVSWARIGDPSAAFASRMDVSASLEIELKKKDSVQRAIEIMKRELEKSLPGDMMETLARAKTPNQLLDIFCGNINVHVKEQHVSLNLTRKTTGGFTLIMIPDTEIDGRSVLSILNTEWISLLNDIKGGRASAHFAQFINYWLTAAPIVSCKIWPCSYTSVILTAVLMAMGVQPTKESVWDTELEYIMMMEKDFTGTMKKQALYFQKAAVLPPIIECMPNIQVRMNFVQTCIADRWDYK